MTFSLQDQLRLLGPKSFEELCTLLLRSEFPESRRVDGAGGDKGIDIFEGDLDSGNGKTLRVWQVKFFRDRIRDTQRRQILRSLDRVVSENSNLARWTLVLPIDPNVTEHFWLASLSSRYPHIEIDKPFDADEIVKWLLKRDNERLLQNYFLPSQGPLTESLTAILSRLNDFESVANLVEQARHDLISKPKNASTFYNGTLPDWKDIQSNFDSYREKFGDLWSFLSSRGSNLGGGIPFALITGRSGEGKSTLLMRLGAELVSQGHDLVFDHKHDQPLQAEQLCQLPRSAVSFVLVDRFTRFSPEQIHGFFDRLHRQSVPVIVIGTAIRSLWDSLNLNLNNVADVCEFDLDMTDADIEELLDKLSADRTLSEEYLGELAKLSREKRIQVFRENSDRQLLVALLELKRNQAFDAYVKNELADLTRRFGPQLRKTCLFISALHRLDLGMPRQLLQRVVGESVDLDWVFQHTHGLILAEGFNGERIITRHPLVAEVIFADEPNRMAYYKSLIQLATPESNEERLVGRLIWSLIVRRDEPTVESLLRMALAQLPKNDFFLRMHAWLSLRKGLLEEARQSFSRSLRYFESSYALNELAWIERASGNLGTTENPSPESARGLFRRSIAANPREISTWMKWAVLEKQHGNLGTIENPEPYTARWLLAQAVREGHSDAELLRGWARLESEQNNLGGLTDPDPSSARGLFQKAAQNDPKNPSILLEWARFEARHDNAGDSEDPRPNTARWLFLKAHEIDHGPSSLMEAARFETTKRNYGDRLDPAPHTARWFLSSAVKTAPLNPLYWIAWAKTEASLGNLGAVHASERLTARWLFAEAVRAQPKNAETLCKWARFEVEQGNDGERRNPSVNSARWLYDKATQLNPNNGTAWAAWAQLEKKKKNIGSKGNPEVNTARWLFAKAITLNPKDAGVWNSWARLEWEQENFGNTYAPEQLSARWLFRRALHTNAFDVQILVTWGKLEARLGNAGGIENPAPYTARWLFSKAVNVHPLSQTGLKIAVALKEWATLEIELRNIGEVVRPDRNTARGLFSRALSLDPTDVKTLFAWARGEERLENFGSPERPEPYTARWLFSKALELDQTNPIVLTSYAGMERCLRNFTLAQHLYLSAAEFAENDKSRARTYFDLAQMKQDVGSNDEALQFLRMAIRTDPENHIHWVTLGRRLSFAEQWDESEKCFQRALELKPGDEQTLRKYQMMKINRARSGQ